MSNFNRENCDGKIIDSNLIDFTSNSKIIDFRDVNTLNKVIITNKSSNIDYPVIVEGEGCAEMLREGTDGGKAGGGSTQCVSSLDKDLDSYSDPLRPKNSYNEFKDRYNDRINQFNPKALTTSITTKDMSSLPCNLISYNTNAQQISKVKTTNSYASSDLLPEDSQDLSSLPLNDIHNQSKCIKSQNIAFSLKCDDFNVRKVQDESVKSSLNFRNSNSIIGGGLETAYFSNFSLGKNNKILNSGENASNLTSEVCSLDIGDLWDKTQNELLPNSTKAIPPVILTKERTLPNSLYTNNCYLSVKYLQNPDGYNKYIMLPVELMDKYQLIPQIINDSQVKPQQTSPNSHFYGENEERPLKTIIHDIVTPPDVTDNFKNSNTTKIGKFTVTSTNDNVRLTYNSTSDDNTEDSFIPPVNSIQDKYVVLPRALMDEDQLKSQIINDVQLKPQQTSPNNHLYDENNYSPPGSLYEEVPLKTFIPDIETLPTDIIDNVTNTNTKKIGKFTVTTTNDNLRLTYNLIPNDNAVESFIPSVNTIQDMYNKDFNKITGCDNRQPISRFKKTRIKETIERWFVNGLNTYDCRFKDIPPTIMSLRLKNFEHTAEVFDQNLCTKCGFHDSGYYCYSTEYKNKRFNFWNNGNRIFIGGNSEYETKNYCQFHGQNLKLLNQNQNINLSKISPKFLIPTNNTRSSSPHIIRAVLISSPENETFTLNIDTNPSQNVALSAPPVTPSVMNSAPMSSIPMNFYSPQSTGSMVMLRCQTPVLFSNASRNNNIMSDSISIGRISRRSSSKLSESDNQNFAGQPILISDNSLIEMWPDSQGQYESVSLKLSQPTCMTSTVCAQDCTQVDDVIYNGQQSLYSVGPIPHIFCSVQQQMIPTISTDISGKQTLNNFLNISSYDDYDYSDSALSSNVIQEVENSMNSLKSMIQNLVQIERKPLISEIKLLQKINEDLKNELLLVKKRSQDLERLMKEKNIPIVTNADNENLPLSSLPSLNSKGDLLCGGT